MARGVAEPDGPRQQAQAVVEEDRELLLWFVVWVQCSIHVSP